MRPSVNAANAGSLEQAVGRVLRLGITASSVCLGIGLALALGGVAPGLARRLLTTGLMILLATPISRVAVSAVDYARERDWLFVALTLIVLLELAASVVAAVFGVNA
jgi:uncharacterized membrane protein